MRIMRVLARVLFVVLLGLMVGVVLVEDEPWVRDSVQQWFNTFFSQMYACQFDSRIELLHVLSGKVAVHDLHARDPYGHWEWKAERGQVYFSFLDLLRYGCIRLNIVLDDCTVKTDINQRGVAIVPHFVLMAQPVEDSDVIPVIVGRIKIRSAYVRGVWPGTEYAAYAHGVCHLDTTTDSFKSSVLINDAALCRAQKNLVTSDSIIFESACDFDPFGKEYASLNASCELPGVVDKNRVLSTRVQWDKKGTCLVCENSDKSLFLDAHCDDHSCVTSSWVLPMSFIAGFFNFSWSGQCSGTISGSCSCDTDWVDQTLTGFVAASDVSIGGIALPNCSVQSQPAENGHGLCGSFGIESQEHEYVVGSWSCDRDEFLGKACLHNAIQLPYQWSVVSDGANIDWTYNRIHKELNGSYTMTVQRDVGIGDKKNVCVTGFFDANAQTASCSGMYADIPYALSVVLQPYISLRRCSWGHDTVLSYDGKTFNFSCGYSFVADILRHSGISLPGVGSIACHGECKGSKICGDFSCCDMSIRVPGTYNVVTGVQGSVIGDYVQGVYTLENTHIALHEGDVAIPQASIFLDGLKPEFAHIPVMCSSCFVNYGKDIFARVSGGLTLVCLHGRWECSGLCSIDESHMRANLLSQDFQLWKGGGYAPHDSVFDDWRLDIGVQTRVPLHIATSFLDGDVAADMSIRGTVNTPIIQGCVQFLHGTLQFPYAPLFITEGSLVFDADDVQQSFVSLRAESSIKKYSVHLDVSGTLDDPVIRFDSSPMLEKEQIITLLLGGSEDGALYFVMPKVLTETLENLVFGSKDTVSVAQRSIRKFFKPFRNVWLVPSLSDQTGRGGLKGSVIIEVSERLKAIIEKNFSKPEATRVEVEYFLADEVDLKLFKNSWGDFGAEVEMRYGFGN